MRPLILAPFALAVLAALAACDRTENRPGPGSVTVGEAKALDEAAEMLEERSAAETQLQPAPAAKPDAG